MNLIPTLLRNPGLPVLAFSVIAILLLFPFGKNVEKERAQAEGADMCMHRGLKSAKATKYLDGVLFEATCLNGDRVTRTRDE